ncbi:MAG: outer membrane beta-barrel protein [Pirellulales bacterium]|nr:outer membrane beta-barrel protein [Pirellulales bacterium]
MPARPDAADVPDPAAAEFDQWQPLVDPNRSIYDDPAEPRPCDDEPADGLRPFDYLRHAGFHHSSTEGRFLSKNIAMTTSSWLNRPYHVDWFAGPLISDDPVEGRVSQSNEILVGLRLGWDFDYYWGLQWRFGWADADIVESGGATPTSGTYFVGDVDLLYYPWGDTKVRPYFQLGLGGSQIGSIRSDGSGQEAWLLGMPFGLGVEFPQTRWLAWRLEVIDNLAFGSDGLDTMHNVSFTAGMEYRFGARPGSYWPWRSSRTSW